MTKELPKNDASKTDKKKPSTFVAKVDKDTQDAVMRNLYIPELLKDHLKKPHNKRSR